MKNACSKDILRQIIYNPRRFIAIFLIVALGVAFFSGVRATSPDMRLTLDQYYNDYNASDIQLFSTLGFDKEDIEELQKINGLQSIMPAYSVDGFLENEESPLLVKLQSLDIQALQDNPYSVLNQPVLIEGDYPQAENECLIDEKLKKYSNFKIGNTIKIQTDVDPAIIDSINNLQYKISGFVRSLEYISLERGTSSKGSGTLDGFILLPKENFKLDVYTNVYFKVDSNSTSRFSDSYNTNIKGISDQIKEVGTKRNPVRFEKIKSETEDKLLIGRQEISDGEKKLADGEKELQENEQKLADSEKEISNKYIEYNEKIKDSQKQLDEAKKELDNSAASIDQNQKDLDAEKNALEQGRTELEKTKVKLDEGAKTLQQLQGQIEQLSAQVKHLPPDSPQSKQLAEQLSNMQKIYQEKSAELTDGQNIYAASLDQLNANETKLREGEAALVQGRRDLNKGKEEYEKNLTLFINEKTKGAEQLNNAQMKLNDSRQKLTDACTQFNQEKPDAQKKLNDARQKVADGDKQLSDLKVPEWYVLDLKKNIGFDGYKQDTSRVAAIGLVFPLIFFLVAALVSLTNMTRMVEDDRTTIGIMKALGYGRMAIASKYLIYAGTAALGGIVLGILVGGKLFPWVIYDAYGILYKLPPLIMPINKESSALAGFGAFICAVVPAFLVCQKELMSTPASLMRPRAPKEGKRILLEKTTILWKHLNFSQKVTCRNIFLYKKRLLMTVLGIAGCTALIFTGFGIRDSIRLMVPIQYDEIQKYDMLLSLKENISDEDKRSIETKLNENSNIRDHLYFHQQTLDVVVHNQIKNANLIVPQDEQQFPRFINLRDRRSGRKIALSDNGIVLSEKICRMMGVKKGDIVELKNADNQVVQATVDDVTENYVYHYVYMSPTLYKRLFGSIPDSNSVFAQLTDTSETAENTLSETLLESKAVSLIFFNTSLRIHFSDMIKALNIVVLVLIVSAAALAFIVLFSLTNINIDERKREIATLKVLGFYNGETSMYLYRENIILTLIGIVIGLGIGYSLLSYVLTTTEVDLVMFTRKTSWFIYFISSLLTFLFSVVVNVLTNRIIRNIDMVESLKSVE